MAAVRPKVTVTQQFASPSTTASVPDLTLLIVGPAYHIRDYESNKADIQTATDYGVKNDPCDATGAPDNIPLTGTDAITISEPIDNATGAILDSASVVIYLDEVLVQLAIDDDGVRVNNQNTLTSSTDFIVAGIEPGDRVVITDVANAITVERFVQSVDEASPLELTLTANVNTTGTDIDGVAYSGMALTGLEFRVEREVNDKILDSSFYTITDQEVVIEGGITISDASLPAPASLYTVDYAKVYQQYRSLRQDLPLVTEIEDSDALEGELVTLDERNPLYVGAFVALQNTSSPVKIFGITGDNLNGAVDRLAAYTVARDFIEARKDVYCIVYLATESSINALWRNHVIAMADPEESNFRIAIGSSPLPITKDIGDDGTAADELSTTSPIVVFVDPAADFVTDAIIAGDTLVITGTGGLVDLSGTYDIRRVLSATILEMEATDIFDGLAAGQTSDYNAGSGKSVEAAATVTTRRRIVSILDNTATFVTDGVIVGDLLNVPANGGTDLTTTLNSFTVSDVVSENRLEVDIDVEGDIELPSLTGGTTVDASFAYQVVRTLSKADQVDELNAVTLSLKNTRMVMVWPDECKVSGVQNAYTNVQNDLPGYYLACAVGGMVAGFPSHQNFTNLGIAGIDSVSNSSNYFSNDQIDELSNGGWYVVLQDTPNALPYSVHALTTDTTTLESGELMFVKNFDFVSLFLKNILVAFLSGYNVLPETLDLIQNAMESGAAQLKSRKYLKIGSPLLDSTIESLSVVDGSADQVELFMTVELPKPLNRIGLYLTA